MIKNGDHGRPWLMKLSIKLDPKSVCGGRRLTCPARSFAAYVRRRRQTCWITTAESVIWSGMDRIIAGLFDGQVASSAV